MKTAAAPPTFKNPNQAFETAIAQGRLTDVASAPHYAGRYMYMGTVNDKDLFKHILTREYLP